MVAVVSGSADKDGSDDLIRLLDQPQATGSGSDSSTVNNRRIPTCTLIVLSVVIAVALLAYSVWPRQAGGAQPWKTREITLPAGAGTAYHRDRVIDTFFGTFERRIDIDGRYKAGTVWLPPGEQSGSTHGDFIWHVAGPQFGAQGPWLEIKDMTADYLIDMREIVLYQLYRIKGQVCVVVLNEGHQGDGETNCDAARDDGQSAMNISTLAESWSSRHLGLLDQRPQFVPGEAVVPSEQKAGIGHRKPPAHGDRAGRRTAGCPPPPRRPRRALRGPPRMEYIGVSGRPGETRCPPPPRHRTGPSN